MAGRRPSRAQLVAGPSRRRQLLRPDPPRLTEISSSKMKKCLSLWPFCNADAPPRAVLQAPWRPSRVFTRGADGTSGFGTRGDSSHRSHLGSAQVMTGNPNKAEMFVRARRRPGPPAPVREQLQRLKV